MTCVSRFVQISHLRHLCSRVFGFAAAIAFATFAIVITAVGQASSAELPTDCSSYESIPLPAAAESAPVPNMAPACASYRSYRGIGRPVDYSEARACAWQERLAKKAGLQQNQKEPTAWFIGGSLILADIYFNGDGVKRNIPLAMRFACESEEGMVEIALPDIAKRDASPAAGEPFEFCHYAATTMTMTFCSSYEAQIANDRRSRYYNSLKSSMTLEQKAAFERLLAAQKTYVGAHASEVDQGGTIRGIRTLGSQNIVNDLFHTEVVRFERREWPQHSREQTSIADALLRREYEKKLQQLRAQTKEATDEGAVTADHFSNVEEAWESYRDAWVAFAHLRYPSAVAAIRAEITLHRYRLVKTI